MRLLQDLVMFIARVLLAFVFTYFAVDQVMHWDSTVSTLAARGVAMPAVVAAAGVVLEFVGALALFFGVKTRMGAFLLLIYVVVATGLHYDVKNVAEVGQEATLAAVLNATVLVAALLYVLTAGAGRFSLDCLACRGRRHGDKMHSADDIKH